MMRSRTLLLILMTILGLLLALGLQGCLFGGGGGEEGGDSGEAADTGEAPGEGEGEAGAPPPGEGMGGPPPGEGAEGMPTPPGGETDGEDAGMPSPAGAAGAGGGANASGLVEEGMDAKRAGNYQVALEKFEAAVAADPSSVDAHWGLAWVAAELGNTDQAVTEFQKVIDLGASQDRAQEAQDALDRLQ